MAAPVLQFKKAIPFAVRRNCAGPAYFLRARQQSLNNAKQKHCAICVQRGGWER
jgi:hypothetical protein